MTEEEKDELFGTILIVLEMLFKVLISILARRLAGTA